MDKSKSKNLTKDITQIALFVALMIVFTLYVSIPFFPVPLTFQTVICVCAGLFLGKRKGAISMAIYLFMGLVCHLPVFSGATGGFSSVFKPSFGYIIGFVLAAYAAGQSEATGMRRPSVTYLRPQWDLLVAMLSAYRTLRLYGSSISEKLTYCRQSYRTTSCTCQKTSLFAYLQH